MTARVEIIQKGQIENMLLGQWHNYINIYIKTNETYSRWIKIPLPNRKNVALGL